MKLFKTDTRLTSAEMAALWTTHMYDSMTVCVLQSFLQSVQDSEVRSLLKYALGLSEKHMKWITEIFNQEQFPIPVGFSHQDVNLKAPRLFSDTLYPFYLEYLARFGMMSFSLCLPLMARSDVRQFVTEALNTSKEISDRVVKLLVEKGLFVRPPYISVPKKVDFVTKTSFLGSWIGRQRPLLAVEILNLFGNLRSNVVVHTMCLGLAQVAEQKDVQKYLLKGRDLATKHMELLSGILRDDDIPASTNWDAGVTDSVVAPFSEKLMVYHVAQLTAPAMVAGYAASLAVSLRKDLARDYARLIAEMMAYSEDGINLTISKGWFEQPPQNISHTALAAK